MSASRHDPGRSYQDANAVRRGAEQQDPDTKKTLGVVADQLDRVGDAIAELNRDRGGAR